MPTDGSGQERTGVGDGADDGSGASGVTSTPMVGMVRSIHFGIHQLTGPRISMMDGTSNMRTMVASTSTAVASPSPKTLRMCSGSFMTKDANTQNMMAAAAVMMRPVTASPSATESELSFVRSHSSRMRDSRKTS